MGLNSSRCYDLSERFIYEIETDLDNWMAKVSYIEAVHKYKASEIRHLLLKTYHLMHDNHSIKLGLNEVGRNAHTQKSVNSQKQCTF